MKNPYSSITKIFLLLSVCTLLLFSAQAVSAQNTTVKVEPSTTTPIVGETLTVNITIRNVQNLFGLNVTLSWNNSVLQLTNVDLKLGVSSYPDGVLHGNRLNYDSDSLISGDIYVEEIKLSGYYELVAQTIGQATASFTGSGTIATLMFNVTSLGRSTLKLETELADKPPAGGDPANFIPHDDVSSTIDVSIPEFPTLLAIVALIVLGTGALVYARKYTKKNPPKA